VIRSFCFRRKSCSETSVEQPVPRRFEAELVNDETGLVYLCEDPPSSIAVATAASFVAIFCVSGNVLLLYVLLRHEDLRQVTSLLVLNMAASDLLLATTLPFWSTYHLSHWVFGPALCRVLIGAYFAGLYCGLMFLTALTVDRYVTVPPGERTAYLLQVGLLFLLPLAVVVYCYARHRTVTVVLCIVAAFFVCWGPYNALLVLEAVYGMGGMDCDSRAWMDLALACTRVLAYCHCCLNPILYAFTHRFRAHLAKVFLCCRPRQPGAANEGAGVGSGAGPGTVQNSSNSLWKEGVTGGEVSVATPKINPGMGAGGLFYFILLCIYFVGRAVGWWAWALGGLGLAPPLLPSSFICLSLLL
ncbi:C-C chemokine receptor type 3-like, partial [Anguilla rostrata]|uniref:C-C chemokine receptor type 3-like n=1 Tax=Anguilla rostrata TaxID=7938 RepID=UPI0030D12A8A